MGREACAAMGREVCAAMARGVRGRSSVRLGTPCAESNKRRQQRRGTFPLLHTPRTCCVLRRMLPTRKCPSQHARGTPGSGRSLARPLFTESPGQGLQSAGISFGEGSLAGIAFGEAQSAGIAFGEGDSAGISFREARQTENRQNLPRQTQKRQKPGGRLVKSSRLAHRACGHMAYIWMRSFVV